MRIGVVTLPPRDNYGGAMQAYALVRVLRNMGHDAYLVMPTTNPRYFKLKPLYAPFVYLKRAFKRYVLGDKSVILFVEQLRVKKYHSVHREYKKFVDDNIEQYRCKDYSSIPSDLFDAFVVGSDQVWRPNFFSKQANEFYLGFAEDWDIKRYVYAASFGLDKMCVYSYPKLERCAELAKLFDTVSVREDSAVNLCREHLGVEAEHLLDPTMLFDKDHYIELVKKESTLEDKLFEYILYDEADSEPISNVCCEKLNLGKVSLITQYDFLDTPWNECKPSPSRWLANFRDAKFVVTDSFHGVIFSIIFNKPFVVILNTNRDPIRYRSVLKIFGLEDRAICDLSGLKEQHFDEIDWRRVNTIKKEWQEKSFNYIKRNIG